MYAQNQKHVCREIVRSVMGQGQMGIKSVSLDKSGRKLNMFKLSGNRAINKDKWKRIGKYCIIDS